MNAGIRYLAVPSAAAGALIVILLFVLSRIPSMLTTLAFLLLSLAVVAGLCGEIALWLARGTRRIELSGESLTLTRGKALVPVRIERGEVERKKSRSALGLRTLTLHLVSGKRVRLSSQAFPEEAFTRFLEAIADW